MDPFLRKVLAEAERLAKDSTKYPELSKLIKQKGRSNVTQTSS
ncbi:hypothetical protein KP77_25370 [Jeotgalibacillus alimentarius]|uniref:Uncharacterized protein n=1 Tax=Jeotgalibacillus alimentarius TaxID=135826 RepID=A0A0C2VSL5_9BACL|nr:hypothetical protein KP77_25370 [Jeotgalibacillus alimentarius]